MSKMKRYSFKLHYFLIGVRDALRLWHIRAIAALLVITFVFIFVAFVFQSNSFISSVLISCATGLITGVILFIVSQLKTSQSYVLANEQKAFQSKLADVRNAYNYLLQFYSDQYPASKDIAPLKELIYDKASKAKLQEIIRCLQTMLSIDFDQLLAPLNYGKKYRDSIFSKVDHLKVTIDSTKEILDIGLQQNDANNIYKSLDTLRDLIYLFYNLQHDIWEIMNKYHQLQNLINSKFL